ncbi:hypothetical protein CYMTET_24271, partial [Cymbomonas tetramitiformis]
MGLQEVSIDHFIDTFPSAGKGESGGHGTTEVSDEAQLPASEGDVVHNGAPAAGETAPTNDSGRTAQRVQSAQGRGDMVHRAADEYNFLEMESPAPEMQGASSAMNTSSPAKRKSSAVTSSTPKAHCADCGRVHKQGMCWGKVFQHGPDSLKKKLKLSHALA